MKVITSGELLRWRWKANLARTSDHAPLIPPLFVAEQGPAVQVVDIRPRAEATGVLGYIPGSCFLSTSDLNDLATGGKLGSPPLVVVSNLGRSAATVARDLESQGLAMVAALADGLAGWRAQGLATSRDSSGVRDTLFAPQGADSEAGALTLGEIRQHIGDPRAVRWIKFSSMISEERLSCIDGRDERGVIGSPGGSGGEYLLGLAALERVTGRVLDEPAVEAGLLERFDLFGKFYVHTDVHAFEDLTEDLKADPRLRTASAGCDGTQGWFEFLRSPDPDLRDVLLEQLVKPEHVGCGHIRLMLQRAEEYGIRSELVRSFLRSFFRLWWEGSPETVLTILPGEHAEGAVVNVRQAEGVWGLSHVPLISPTVGGRQVFVNHPDVSAHLRHNLVQWLVRSSGSLGVEASQESELQTTIAELAGRQLGVTVGHLAKGLPVFDVVFGEDGSFEVNQRST